MSTVIEEDFVEFTLPSEQCLDALGALHYYCFETDEYRNVYIAGQGAVGKALLKILSESDAKTEVRAISAHESEDEEFFKKSSRKRLRTACSWTARTVRAYGSGTPSS